MRTDARFVKAEELPHELAEVDSVSGDVVEGELGLLLGCQLGDRGHESFRTDFPTVPLPLGVTNLHRKV